MCVLCEHKLVGNAELLYIIIPCRISVTGSIVRILMIVATAPPNINLPWMVPHVEQRRLATKCQ